MAHRETEPRNQQSEEAKAAQSKLAWDTPVLTSLSVPGETQLTSGFGVDGIFSTTGS